MALWIRTEGTEEEDRAAEDAEDAEDAESAGIEVGGVGRWLELAVVARMRTYWTRH